MLEFLKDSSELLYRRGKDVEKNLNALSPVSSMRSFFETALKLSYQDYYPGLGKEALDHIKFVEMIKDPSFELWYGKTYGYSHFHEIDQKIRGKGNRGIHSIYYRGEDPRKVKELFRFLYDFAANWHFVKSSKRPPEWNDGAYKELCDHLVRFDSREEAEILIKPRMEEAEQKYKEIHEELNEARKECIAIKQELDETKKSSIDPMELERANARIAGLEQEINQEKNRSAKAKAELSDAEAKLLASKGEMDRLTRRLNNERNATDRERANLSKSLRKVTEEFKYISKSRDDLDAENQRLSKQLFAMKEAHRQEIERLEKTQIASIDPKLFGALSKRLEEAEKRCESLSLSYQNALKEKEELENKLFIADSQIEKERETELRSLVDRDKEEDQCPVCSECGTVMKPFRSLYDDHKVLWRCPKYKNGCNAKMVFIPEKAELGETLLAKSEKDKEIHVPSLSASVINDKKSSKLAASYYPDSKTVSSHLDCLFDSLSFPAEYIEAKGREALGKFAHFELFSNAPETTVEKSHRAVYSLMLKLLNRGYVTPSPSIREKYISQRFEKNLTFRPEQVFATSVFKTPAFLFRNEKERKPLTDLFKTTFGLYWASFISKDARGDLILPDEDPAVTKHLMADYFVSKWLSKKAVILIDRKLNEGILEKLSSNKIEVFEISSADLTDKRSEFRQRFLEYFKPVSPPPAPEGLQYLCSHKIIHQLVIAITKLLEQGIIEPNFKLAIQGNVALLSRDDLEYLLYAAIEEVRALVENYGKIYDISIPFSMMVDGDHPDFTLYLGDGKEDEQSATIRDISLAFHYLADIKPFSLDYLPVNASVDALRFFLEYAFGFPDFREGQLVAIKRLLSREDSIILLPTGAGKSIIYQLVSLLCPGLIIVISPLVSLIEDQVANLGDRYGIDNAVSITSGSGGDERNKKAQALRIMKHNSTSLLYISPERLQIASFREQVKQLLRQNNVYAVAIDEAHCVSEWGHDFRPAYLNIGNLSRRLFAKEDYVPPLIALTGTASEAVLSDVQRDLQIASPRAIIRPTTFDRSELHFSVEECDSANKIIYIGNLIKNDIPEAFGLTYEGFAVRRGKDTVSGIVFTPFASSKRGGQYFADSLQYAYRGMFPEMGVGCYFSKVPDGYEDKGWKATVRHYAKRFKNNELNMLVATKAYGMGIDKGNIRFTIHDGIPSSIEQYYQEAGRAGRNRSHSECVLVFSEDDPDRNEELINPNLTLPELMELYDECDDVRDDLNVILYFHMNTFKGIETEYTDVAAIIDELANQNLVPGDNGRITIPESAPGSDNEKKYILAMIRLVILGVVKDYVYSYDGVINITMGSMGKSDIIDAYDRYVTSFRKGRSVSERKKLESNPSKGWDFVKAATHVLIEYVYDFIEQGRRAEIRNMYHLAKSASLVDKEEQDEYVRDQINKYFSFKDEINEELQRIVSYPNAGFDQIEKVFPFHLDALVANDDEREKALTYLPAIDRLLESQPDHPGLLILRAIADMKTGKSTTTNVVNYTAGAFRYAIDRYLVSEDICIQLLIKVLNLSSHISVALFEAILDELAKGDFINCSAVVEAMVESEYVSDDFRNYLMLVYIEYFFMNKGDK